MVPGAKSHSTPSTPASSPKVADGEDSFGPASRVQAVPIGPRRVVPLSRAKQRVLASRKAFCVGAVVLLAAAACASAMGARLWQQSQTVAPAASRLSSGQQHQVASPPPGTETGVGCGVASLAQVACSAAVAAADVGNMLDGQRQLWAALQVLGSAAAAAANQHSSSMAPE